LVKNDYAFRLVLGKSNIHGWGLFTLDDIPEDTFIREYTGEYLSDEEEISKRGSKNNITRTTYMFQLADPTTIDSMFMGNKTRFCNHSKKYDNIIVKIINDSGIYRICLFSKRRIQRYEELLFNYQIETGKDEISNEEIEQNDINETGLALKEFDQINTSCTSSGKYLGKYLNKKRNMKKSELDEEIKLSVKIDLGLFYIDSVDLE